MSVSRAAAAACGTMLGLWVVSKIGMVLGVCAGIAFLAWVAYMVSGDDGTGDR